MIIRPARVETDLPAITRLINPYETNPVTVEQVRGWFDYNPPERITCRLVAVDEQDAVTGYCVVNHEASMPAGQFHIWLVADPTLRGRGIGSALCQAALGFLQAQGAAQLKAEVNDHDAASLSFAEKRGFCIDRRLFHSFLDLTTFDESPYLPAITGLEQQGVRFCSLADFPDTPETRRKLYDLNASSVLDIPGVTNLPWTFEGFEQLIITAPWFNRAGQLLAVDGDDWVGLSAVSLNAETHQAYNEHTGVRRTYRGRKIAQALKVLAARYARAAGAQRMSTDNDSFNAPMLAINRKLGYQPEAGQYLLVRMM